jgi:hypothetical protein
LLSDTDWPKYFQRTRAELGAKNEWDQQVADGLAEELLSRLRIQSRSYAYLSSIPRNRTSDESKELADLYLFSAEELAYDELAHAAEILQLHFSAVFSALSMDLHDFPDDALDKLSKQARFEYWDQVAGRFDFEFESRAIESYGGVRGIDSKTGIVNDLLSFDRADNAGLKTFVEGHKGQAHKGSSAGQLGATIMVGSEMIRTMSELYLQELQLEGVLKKSDKKRDEANPGSREVLFSLTGVCIGFAVAASDISSSNPISILAGVHSSYSHMRGFWMFLSTRDKKKYVKRSGFTLLDFVSPD